MENTNNLLINAKSKSYPIYFGNLSSYIEHLQSILSKKILIVTTDSIAKILLNDFLSLLCRNETSNPNRNISIDDIPVCIIQDGESNKDLSHIEYILDCAFRAKLNRNSLMIALGGGVITDMVGFASGIYQRGIDFISIPTTLLSMVDASVGGKCGINNKYGKNLVGIFHQPNEVYIDSRFLTTLPKREISAGFAEIIKIFACFDFYLLEELDKELQMLESKNNQKYIQAMLLESSMLTTIIQKSVMLKAKVVEQDEEERNGSRAILNYGHTFGHAIELESNFTQYLHGEAVSMGIVMANRLSCKLGILNQKIARDIESLLYRCGLPIRYKIKDIESFYQSFFLDKKSLDSKLHFVLLQSNPNIFASLHNDIDKDILLETLHEFS
ncbi:3-dehydroquinate synthase [Helicobacter muridarum]|uniref:3-dehydroquinate synthase n=1 Tax=Helicobacter muridarum TaxID=216 RepID=A0A099TXK3_9HELI|nr:3-dehydroquinate synthase [Helicobacter muridarum]TLD97934.1 3-dehydroquinate synthase [Helicobacter muridarum]STQ85447.1 3-dehydroquinate synthase [Helicobacter muridarum]